MNVDFRERKPNCFGEFVLIGTENPSKDPEFVSRYVECKCGNKNLNIYTSYANGMNLAPVSLECPSCGYKSLVFNPEIHGWDGQNGDNCSMVGAEEPRVLPACPMRVMVEYSYQGMDNYLDLEEDGISNLEDYFDTINIYGLDSIGNIIESIDYECA